MLVTYKNGTKKESVVVSVPSNFDKFKKYFYLYTKLEAKNLKYKHQKVNQEKLNAIEKLGSAIFDFEIVNINDNQKKAVANFNEVILRLNQNTNNSFKSIEKNAKKEQKEYLNQKKSSLKLRLKNLKKVSKNRNLTKSGSTYFGTESIKFSGKIPQVIKSFSESAKKSITFHGVTYDKYHKFDTANYEYFSHLLKNKEVVISKELEKTQKNRKINKIEKKYDELCYKTNICNLLKEAIKYCDSSVMPNTKEKIKQEYENLRKEIDKMNMDLLNDMKYLKNLSHGGKTVDEEKDIIDKAVEGAKNIGNSVVKSADKVAEKIEEKKEEKKIDTAEELFEKIIEQKISELDDSLSFSLPAGSFKKFKYLSEEQQYVYKEYLKEYLTKRVGESVSNKALMDAKFECRILEKFYGVRKERFSKIMASNQMSSLDKDGKEIINLYINKLAYNKSEEMFKDYELKVKEIYKKHKIKMNGDSPLVEASIEKLEQAEKLNGGRSL